MSDGRVALMIISHVVYSIFSVPYLVPWSSNKQITNTTTESKALTNGTAEVIWVQSVLMEH
jgi:hypothetical protein